MKNSSRITKICVSCVLLTVIISYSPSLSEPSLEGRNQVVLEGEIACVSVDAAGGAIVDFHLKNQNLNPFTWNYPEKGDLTPRPMGHFICFDRWGQPSPQELKNGMPFHGEASKVEWTVISPPVKKDGTIIAEMLCELPIGGLELRRTLSLSENAPVLLVEEVITNVNKLGRVYNIVQHPSIAPPFLDDSVIVDCNAYKGYLQESPWPTPEEPVIYWPEIAYKGRLVDLRRLADDPNPGVTSFVFTDEQEYGWVTACNPGKGLLLGYIWDLSEYPWLNIWRNVRDGKPAARGLEFGTTGLHKPFGDMLAKGTIFDKPLCEYIDAGQTLIKSYTAFLSKIPADYRGVEEIDYMEGKIVIKERESDESRNIILKY